MSALMYDFDLCIKNEGYSVIAGVDEAGRGPLAGPVFACAIIMKEDIIIKEVNDSKKISEKKRENLYDIILSQALDYGIASVDPEEIDRINILNAAMLAMGKALDSLKATPDLALIDGNRFTESVIPHRLVIKGDAKSYHIAAASIIAKVSRDRYMRAAALEYPEYQFEKHKGYGTKEHISRIAQYGLCPIHRKSFCKKIGNMYGSI